jgi:hypothetical protein
VKRECEALHDRLRRQENHANILQARAQSKRSPRRPFKKEFRGPIR